MADKPYNCECDKRPKCGATPLASFPGYEPCDRLPGAYVDAYTDIKLDSENPTGIILDTTWGEVKLDLKSIVKAGETITHLELVPEGNESILRYTNEAGDYECITGDELSRIISLQLLKDVDQTNPLSDGDVYVYNGTTNLFEPYDIKTAIGDLSTFLNRLDARLTNIENRLTDIESIIPFWPTDKTMKLARGNINHVSDHNYTGSNTLSRAHGLFTHDINTDVVDDLVSS